MYYGFRVKTGINDEMIQEIRFNIQLRGNTIFKIIDCYFSVIKHRDVYYEDSDEIIIEYYSTKKDKQEAEHKIIRAIEFFIFLTGIPFDTNIIISEFQSQNLPIIELEKSRKKEIEIINNAYLRINKKRELLVKTLRLNAMAIRFNYMFSFSEDAFFNFFKIIELIAKDEYKCEKQNIEKGKGETVEFINKIVKEKYKIVISAEQINDFSGKVNRYIYETIFENMYPRIAWAKNNLKIYGNDLLLEKSVSLRNKIAHGEIIDVDIDFQEFGKLADMSQLFIYKKFFSNIKKAKIDSKLTLL